MFFVLSFLLLLIIVQFFFLTWPEHFITNKANNRVHYKESFEAPSRLGGESKRKKEKGGEVFFQGGSYPLHQEFRKEVEEGVLHLKAQSRISWMHLRVTKERSSFMLLKVRAFLRFQMLQAMAVLIVASS
jgi:hypothetical protein